MTGTRHPLRIALAFLALLWGSLGASAQVEFPTPNGGTPALGIVMMCYPNGANKAVPCSTGTPLPISGSISASLAGWQPSNPPSYIQLGFSDTANHSVSVAGLTGNDYVITNYDTNIAWCNFGAGSVVNASFAMYPGPTGIHNGTAFGTLQCQSPTGNLAITAAGGTGLYSGPATAGGGGGVGGTVFTKNAPDVATNTSITVADSGVTCANTAPPIQSQCTGAATAGSSAVISIAGQPSGAAVVSITSGTVSGISLSSEFSWDNGVSYYGRGFFLDSNVGPIWKNGIINTSFSGSISVPPGATNWRLRASTLTGSSPNVNVKMVTSNSLAGLYVYNLPTASAGSSSVAAVNIQGEAGGVPVITNQTQIAGTVLSAPTATGVAPAGGSIVENVNSAVTSSALPTGAATAVNQRVTAAGTSDTSAQAVQGATGGVPMPVTFPSFTQLQPTVTLTTPLVPTSGGVASIAAPTGTGATAVFIKNTGTDIGYIRSSVGSTTATANDIPFLPGDGCVLTLGTATWLNAFATTGHAGASFNAIAGNGAGTCPTGGGGGTAGVSGNVFQATLFPAGGNSGTAAITQQIVGVAGQNVYLMNYSWQGQSSVAGTFRIIGGTSPNCTGSVTNLTPLYDMTSSPAGAPGSIGPLGATAAGAAMCVVTTGSNNITWNIGATQQ